MTGAELKTFLENLIDDTIDEDFAYQLLTHAKDLVEGERDWEYLKAVDTSNTWASGETYLSTKALPADFFTPRFLYIDGYDTPYVPVPMEHKLRYRDLSGYYYIDYGSSAFALCGTTDQSRTISFVYTKTTADIGAGVTPSMPARFHKLIGFYAAGLWQGAVDWDDISARMSPANRAEALVLKNSMISWDTRLKLHSQNHSAGISTSVDYSKHSNIIDME
jgi:hypothetical protein